MDNNLKKIIIDFLLLPYKFIQWTKKWHFFHFIFIGSFLIILFNIIGDFIDEIFFYNEQNNINTNTNSHINFELLDSIALFAMLNIFYSIPIAILLSIYELYLIIKKLIDRLAIVNEFLLKNKFYNIFYTFCATLHLIGYIVIILQLFIL